MASIEAYKRTTTSEEVELTELDKKILTCAAEAQISTTQWIQIFEAVGAEKIEDFLQLNQADFDRCNFKPLLHRRVTECQGFLYDRHWNHFDEDIDEDSTTSEGSSSDSYGSSWNVLDSSSSDGSSSDSHSWTDVLAVLPTAPVPTAIPRVPTSVPPVEDASVQLVRLTRPTGQTCRVCKKHIPTTECRLP